MTMVAYSSGFIHVGISDHVKKHGIHKRSNTKFTEVKGSHVVFMSQPEAVAKVIITASETAGAKQ